MRESGHTLLDNALRSQSFVTWDTYAPGSASNVDVEVIGAGAVASSAGRARGAGGAGRGGRDRGGPSDRLEQQAFNRDVTAKALILDGWNVFKASADSCTIRRLRVWRVASRGG